MYFADKNDLLIVMGQEIMAGFGELAAELPALVPSREGFLGLRDWVGRTCRDMQDNASIRGALLDAIHIDADPRITHLALRAMRQWTTVVADRIRATGTPGLDPDIAALCLYSAFDRGNQALANGQLIVSFDELVTALAELLHESVHGTRPADLVGAG